jgi:hypothetical protein
MTSLANRRSPIAALVVLACAGLDAPRAGAAEEFNGPFPSWRDLRRDYGAKGDGKADDTAALQRALDELVKHEKSCVLYVPAGKYRLTRRVKTVRKGHTDCYGVAVVGEDPASTVLLWDGEAGGTMFRWDAWYSQITRLTFDGAGKAGACLVYGPAFSTYNETSDVTFKDAKAGLVFGGPKTNGQAENEVLRCRFLRCETGLQTVNWNSMDVWVWYSRFEDCGRGAQNIMGNWHVWESLFLRSRVADLSLHNLMVFSAVNNTSVGSKCFFDFDTVHLWGSPASVTGNRVLDPTGDWAVRLGNAGPYLVVDNVFRLAGKGRAVRMTWADQTLVGNTYTRADAVEERGRFRRVGEKVVAAKDIPDDLPQLPPTPPRKRRKVFEVAAGAGASAIQKQIDAAAALKGQRPVVHLPMGVYRVDRTLVVPAGADLQLIGDGGGEAATRLIWAGPTDGLVLRLEGPTRAVLRNFCVQAGRARALLVTDADQAGGRVFADQMNADGPTERLEGRRTALRVNGLDRTDVLLRAQQGNGNRGRWVEVLGGAAAGGGKNQVSIFTGATGSAVGQYDVRGGGRLVARGVYHERSTDAVEGLLLTDRGTLSVDATRFCYATSATCIMQPVETKETCRFELRGGGGGASVLALNNQFWVYRPGTTSDTVWQNKARPPARGGLVGCNVNTPNKDVAPNGFQSLPDVGGVDDATLLRHLAPLRQARVWLPDAAPAGATDLRIHRVMLRGGGGTEGGAVVELRAGSVR